MSEQVIIKSGPCIPLGPAVALLFFGTLSVFSLVSPLDPDLQDGGTVAYVFTGLVALPILYHLYCYLSGRVIAVLGPQGLRARSCDNALVPWDLVSKVSRVDKTVGLFAMNMLMFRLKQATRHDLYEVVLDKKALDIGVKHGEFLTQIGFALEPLYLTITSQELAAIFRRYLPPERCVDFPAEQRM